MQLPVNDPIIAVVGPTAVGKTAVGIQLAQRFSGEVISVDSRYLYRGMDIGTAKPTTDEMAGVPHHLIDIVNPDEIISLPQFQKAVYACIPEIKRRQRLPFLVGGTGQYLWSVVEGWLPPKTKPNLQLRTVLEAMAEQLGAEKLHAYVQMLDPTAAKKIEPRNIRRSVRALEVMLSSGELFSEQGKKSPPPYDFKIIGLERAREELYARADERIHQMLDIGFVDEAEKLLASGFTEDLPAMSAIGYKEVIQYIQGKMSMAEAVTLMKRRTRNFIRHQSNWFKQKDERIHWFKMDTNVVDRISEYILSEDGWI